MNLNQGCLQVSQKEVEQNYKRVKKGGLMLKIQGNLPGTGCVEQAML